MNKRMRRVTMPIVAVLAYEAGRAQQLPRALKRAWGLPTLHRLALATSQFLIFWTVVWIVQWALAPGWLVSTRSGLSTLFQTLPGVLIALFALIVASLYILGQQASTAYGHRSVAVLMTDVQAGALMIRALILATVPLLVSGQVPDHGDPSAAITSLTATALLATAVLILRSTNTLAALLGSYIAPRSFVLRTLRYVPVDLAVGALTEVVYKVTALTDMLRSGIRRGELNTVEAALFGLDEIANTYIDVAQFDPSVRTQSVPDNEQATREGWFGYDVAGGFLAAGEEALGRASQEETNLLARWFEEIARRFVDAKLETESRQMITAHMALGTSPHQVRPETINLWPQAAGGLAVMEHAAEHAGLPQIAAEALSGWALVTAYPEIQFDRQHPSKAYSLSQLGAHPQWDEALQIIRSMDWQRTWTNKTGGDFRRVEEVLLWARGNHRSDP